MEGPCEILSASNFCFWMSQKKLDKGFCLRRNVFVLLSHQSVAKVVHKVGYRVGLQRGESRRIENEFFQNTCTLTCGYIAEHLLIVGDADNGNEGTVAAEEKIVHVLVNKAGFRKADERQIQKFLFSNRVGDGPFCTLWNDKFHGGLKQLRVDEGIGDHASIGQNAEVHLTGADEMLKHGGHPRIDGEGNLRIARTKGRHMTSQVAGTHLAQTGDADIAVEYMGIAGDVVLYVLDDIEKQKAFLIELLAFRTEYHAFSGPLKQRYAQCFLKFLYLDAYGGLIAVHDAGCSGNAFRLCHIVKSAKQLEKVAVYFF